MAMKKRFIPLLIITVLISLSSCDFIKSVFNGDKQKTVQDTTQQGSNVSENIVTKGENGEVNDMRPSLPYEIKDDGLYMYRIHRYIRIMPLDPIVEIRTITDTKETPQIKAPKKLETPSLYELGYKRGEREIYPQDNMFGKKYQSKVPCDCPPYKDYSASFNKESCDITTKYIPKKLFCRINVNEFNGHGLVIIGKQISRVEMYKVNPRKGHPNDILISYVNNCKNIKSPEPIKISDFEAIALQENVFEFIEEEPLPGYAAYLSELQHVRLRENLHQFLPRKRIRPGYYYVKYYNGTNVFERHCIHIVTNKTDGKPRQLRRKSFDEPENQPERCGYENKVYLIVGSCSTYEAAQRFKKMKDGYPTEIFESEDGTKFRIGRGFPDRESAEKERLRLKNAGEQSWIYVPKKSTE